MGRYVVLDSSTGEITQDLGENIDGTMFVPLHSGETIYRPKKMYYDLVRMDYDYVKLNYKACAKLYKECPQFFLLIPFIDFKDNVLKFSNGHNATLRGLARKLGYSENYFKGDFIKKLKDSGLVVITTFQGKRAIIVNPYVVIKGKEISLEVKEMFKDSKWAVLGKGKK